MKYLILIILFCTFISCKKNQGDVVTEEPGIIENKTFNSTLLIDGHAYDGTILINCIFENIEGDGLQIRDVDNLCIENCTFRNISGDAIRFRNSGSSDGVKIVNNQIYNIEENGILAPENHINTLIKGNSIYNLATSNTSSQFGAPHHGIYFQGFNVTITENTIYDVINDEGNCVSIRTYGTVSKNTLHSATDHGISYFSDHPGNGQTLLIENNFIYDNGKRAINLASNGTTSNHIGTANIRFNTLISNDESVIAMNDELTGVSFTIDGNILFRMDGGSNFIFTNQNYTESYNVPTNVDFGFENFANRDLRLSAGTSANGFATGATNFPDEDYFGNPRSSSDLDPGAHQRD